MEVIHAVREEIRCREADTLANARAAIDIPEVTNEYEKLKPHYKKFLDEKKVAFIDEHFRKTMDRLSNGVTRQVTASEAEMALAGAADEYDRIADEIFENECREKPESGSGE